MRVHRLSVHEQRGKARGVKPGQQAVHHNHKVQLLTAGLVFVNLPGQSVIQIPVVCAQLVNRIVRAESVVIIFQRGFHLVLVCRGFFLVLRDGVGNGELREVRQHHAHFFVHLNWRLPGCHLFQKVIVPLGHLNGGRGKNGFIGLSLAILNTKFLVGPVQNGVQHHQHMGLPVVHGGGHVRVAGVNV